MKQNKANAQTLLNIIHSFSTIFAEQGPDSDVRRQSQGVGTSYKREHFGTASSQLKTWSTAGREETHSDLSWMAVAGMLAMIHAKNNIY